MAPLNILPFLLLEYIVRLQTLISSLHGEIFTQIGYVKPFDVEDPFFSNISVYGAQQCGGPGKYVGLYFDDCPNNTQSTCRLTGGSWPIFSSTDFIPSADIEQLGLRVNVTLEGEDSKQIFERPMNESSVIGGTKYRMELGHVIGAKFRPQNITLKYIVYQVASGEPEICVEAPFEIYQKPEGEYELTTNVTNLDRGLNALKKVGRFLK